MDPRYGKFWRLFNAEKFFEAHEVLEALWRETQGRDRDFYQGLIQIAAAYVHVQKGTLKGGRELLKKASEKLERYKPVFLGLEVRDFLKQAALVVESKADFPKIRVKS